MTVALAGRVGLVHLLRHGLAQAQLIFERILQEDDHGEAVWDTVKEWVRMNLALTQLEQGNIEQALPALQQVFDNYLTNPQSARYLLSESEVSLNLGRAFLLAGQAQRALPLLQRAADAVEAEYPKSLSLASHRCWLGLCLLVLGEAPKARALADLARATFDAEPLAGVHYRRSLALLTDQIAAQPPAG